ncbi:L-type lectin-domain containing receptor kinase IX.1 [Manihot esculenta]|uniref:Protein kinase domain-containing protein n=1 Tax=Manihot esculenta TaxID=3983 RepID=A0A2C9VJT7_MANES|nr:L-type lectin-domain containing receptor kinase IX.1 [Manihot esculenta]OAY45261.1 hypothetical protein MANES_07G045600v8 [Manihot esculenta]
MALCKFNASHCHTSMSLSSLIILFFLKITYSNSLTFNFSNFKPNSRCLNYQGNASVSENAIHLTTDPQGISPLGSLGRATYCKPLHLWDKASGNLTDFHTIFSFSIDSQRLKVYGDGLAFFIAPMQFPVGNMAGGGLGLVRGNQTSKYPFLAIEFDSYSNSWDPPYQHVGIDINSVVSNATSAWISNIEYGEKIYVSIRYDSLSKSLSVTFTGFSSNNEIEQHLDYNVDLRDFLPEWVTVGFSAATGENSEKHILHSWYFSSTLQINDKPATSPTDNTPTTNIPTDSAAPPDKSSKTTNIPTDSAAPPDKSSNMVGLVVGASVGGCVFIGIILGLLYFFMWKKRRVEKEVEVMFDLPMDDEFEKSTGPRKFSYSNLVSATKNFSEQEKLGEGGFGAVYKGFLKELDSYIAVKRISGSSKQGLKEFASEVKIISQLRHKNLVQLMGWCHEKGKLLLVYELMPNGSLDSHLFKKERSLTWEARYNIAQGIASGLLYLQEEWEQLVVHRDIKPSNIMLDSNFNAKLGDFGLARLVDHGKVSQTTVLAGTLGYLAPECVITGKASKKSDVYSFGIVALEIACGRKSINIIGNEDQLYIVQWAWDLYGRGKLLEAADSKLNGNFDEQQLERLMVVGLWCAHPDAKLRPCIKQAIQVLNFEAPLPVLPSKLPVPTYLSPPVNASLLPLPSSLGASFSGEGS